MTTFSSEAFKKKYPDQLSTKSTVYLLYNRQQKNVVEIQISFKKTIGISFIFLDVMHSLKQTNIF